MGDKVKIVKLNVDENPDVAAKYGIMSIPTLMMFKNGEMASRQVGAAPKQKLRAVDHRRGLIARRRNIFCDGRPKGRPFALMGMARALRRPFPPMEALSVDEIRRPGMAVRAEVGRLPLPRLSRRRDGRAAIEVRQAADALFPRNGRGGRAR